jgi:hypothetical protein
MNPGDVSDFSKPKVGDKCECFQLGINCEIGDIDDDGRGGYPLVIDKQGHRLTFTKEGYHADEEAFPSLFHPGTLATLKIQPPPKSEEDIHKLAMGWLEGFAHSCLPSNQMYAKHLLAKLGDPEPPKRTVKKPWNAWVYRRVDECNEGQIEVFNRWSVIDPSCWTLIEEISGEVEVPE